MNVFGAIQRLYILAYTRKVPLEKTTKVFWSGNSQAVRIPREFLIDAAEVEIRRRGDTIVLRPRARSWAPLLRSLEKFSEDFMETGRTQPRPEKKSGAGSYLVPAHLAD